MFCLRVKDFPQSRAFLFAPGLLFQFGEVCSFCLLPFFDAIKSSSLEFISRKWRTVLFYFIIYLFLKVWNSRIIKFPRSRTHVRKWLLFRFPRTKVEFPCAEWIFSTLIMSTHATSMGSKFVMVKRFSCVDTHDSLLSRMFWGLSHVLYYLKFRFTDFAS